ncbi:alpha/beta hydrolase [Ideonella sp.]|uniref:alpha/beta fold hydrolase n=1 Tax=Ideonella sp. TaxID=1929293 RepID=UPI002B47E7E8|nr:alpha/beta hydrolase [Ideonella sp.]HJV69693.1 alpha/beta hydrolase [Ideonella sp.]
MKMLLWRAFGILVMLTALAVPIARAPDRPVETLVARWAPAPSDFIEVKGQMVHLRDQGPRDDPRPIVLIHGTSASLHTWEGWAASLKGQHRVISFDLPGFGLTGPFSGAYATDDYRGDTLARFVIDLLDQLKVPHAVLAGNSLGGEVAWRVASLAPARVDKLVLVDASGYDFEPVDMPLGFRLARLPVLSALSEWFLLRGVIDESVRSVYGDPAKVTPALVDRYFELTLREGNRHALRLRMQQLEMGQDVARIAQLKLPTLVIWGGRDRLIPPPIGQNFTRDIAGSRLVVFPALGHVPHEEDPEATVSVVKEFLALR